MDIADVDDRCQDQVGYRAAYEAAKAAADANYLAEHRAEFESMAMYTAERNKAAATQ